MRRLMLALLSLALTAVAASAQSWFGDAGPLSFNAMYSGSSGTSWLAIGLTAIGAGLVIYFTGGVATPLVGSIGSWIGSAAGLSGAAAKAYGLALLGGGALAKGGLGVAGGTALLTAALSFSKDAVPAAISAATERFDRAAFEERVKDAPRFPLPRSGNGPESYKAAMKLLEMYYDPNNAPSDARNADTVEFALRKLKERHWRETTSDLDAARVAGLFALLYFHQGQDRLAKIQAESAALAVARSNKEVAKQHQVSTIADALKVPVWQQAAKDSQGYGLAAALWATASLSEADVDLSSALTAVDATFGMEPKNGLAPLVAAIFLDRLLERPDIMVVDNLARLSASAKDRLTDAKARAATQLVVVTRALMLTKMQQSVVTAAGDRSAVGQIAERRSRAATAFQTYDAILRLAGEICDDLLRDDAFSKEAANREAFIQLNRLINAYRDDRLRLAGVVKALEAAGR